MIQERHDLNMVFRIQGPVMAFVLLIPFSCIDFTGLELNKITSMTAKLLTVTPVVSFVK